MAVQIVMDPSGDTRHEFDAADAASIATAEARFKDLTGRGFRAVALGKNGEPGELTNTFSANIQETLFIPQLVGG